MKMLFVRDYHGYTGGHQKVLDYFHHMLASRTVDPSVYFTRDTVFEGHSPWRDVTTDRIAANLATTQAYFLAGLDWEIIDAHAIDMRGKPVLNLIQHFRHADPSDARYSYLSRPATRVCVTAGLAEALHATGRVNGPIVTIEAGVPAFVSSEAPSEQDTIDVFIGAFKDAQLGREVAHLCANDALTVDLAISFVERNEFLRRMARARVAVVLPTSVEGYFLLPLEAMTLGVPCVTVDCVGNRGFCRDRDTCLVAERDAPSISRAVTQLLRDAHLRERLATRGASEARSRTVEAERAHVLDLVDDLAFSSAL